jgi:hypothetical protein
VSSSPRSTSLTRQALVDHGIEVRAGPRAIDARGSDRGPGDVRALNEGPLPQRPELCGRHAATSHDDGLACSTALMISPLSFRSCRCVMDLGMTAL